MSKTRSNAPLTLTTTKSFIVLDLWKGFAFDEVLTLWLSMFVFGVIDDLHRRRKNVSMS